MNPIRRTTLTGVAILALLVAACGAEEADEPVAEPDEAPAEEEPEEEAPEEEAPEDEAPEDEAMEDEAPAEATLTVAGTDLGEILVDAEGMTLYMFEPDEQGPSVCYDDCAEAWPPLTVDEEPVAGDGVDPDLLGTVERDDGSLQVTYDSWPLYHWAADSEPGDTAGQGVNDVWWVMAPDASIITAADDGGDEDEGTGSPY